MKKDSKVKEFSKELYISYENNNGQETFEENYWVNGQPVDKDKFKEAKPEFDLGIFQDLKQLTEV